MIDVVFALALGLLAWLIVDPFTGGICAIAVWSAISLTRMAFRDR